MPELVDIRDEDGRLTGETMLRSEAHRSESWHGVALVWVYNSQGQILLQRRAGHLNTFPEKWDVSVAGHLTASDEPLQTAVRELSEELGLYVKPEDMEKLGEQADTFALVYGKLHREYDFIYAIKQDVNPDDLNLQAAEVLEARWTTVEELEKDLVDPIVSQHYSKRSPAIYRLIMEKIRPQPVLPA
jgi:isopentenyldiphosphate isomerase